MVELTPFGWHLWLRKQAHLETSSSPKPIKGHSMCSTIGDVFTEGAEGTPKDNRVCGSRGRTISPVTRGLYATAVPVSHGFC